MAIRTRAVRPDMAFEVASGEQIAVVSEDALLEEVVSVARMVNFAGGTMSLVVHRHPTGVPHEMVTVGALIQWQDRTDAKAQPEPAAPAEQVDVEPDEAGDAFDAAETLKAAAAELGLDVTFAPRAEPDPEPEELEEQIAREEEAIPEGAVVMGAPVGAAVGPQGFETPHVTETPQDRPLRTQREEGAGSAALPFQKGDQPGDPPRPVEGGVNLADIAHGDASSLPRGDAIPAPAGSSEGIDDGLVPEADEDDSAIPESRR